MKIMLFLTFFISACECIPVDTETVCVRGDVISCGTAFYHGKNLITTKHLFWEEGEKSRIAHVDHGDIYLDPIFDLGIVDTTRVGATHSFCSPRLFDGVTIFARSGETETRITEISGSVFEVGKSVKHGDSGSPVVSDVRNCITGMVFANSGDHAVAISSDIIDKRVNHSYERSYTGPEER